MRYLLAAYWFSVSDAVESRHWLARTRDALFKLVKFSAYAWSGFSWFAILCWLILVR